jgi:hypothetical protein
MSKLFSPVKLFLFLGLFGTFAATNTNGDSFKGNRRPGILEAASSEPTGENAQVYRRIGVLRANELLDLISEEPTPSSEDRLDNPVEEESSDS